MQQAASICLPPQLPTSVTEQLFGMLIHIRPQSHTNQCIAISGVRMHMLQDHNINGSLNGKNWADYNPELAWVVSGGGGTEP